MSNLRFFGVCVIGMLLQFISCAGAYAQQVAYPVTLSGVMLPPNSVYPADLVNPANEKLRITALLTDQSEPQWDIVLKVTIAGSSVLLQSNVNANYSPVTITPAGTQIGAVELEQYFNLNNYITSGIDRSKLMQRFALPEGLYAFTFQAYDYHRRDKAISAPFVIQAQLLKNNPPLLLQPSCDAVLNVLPVQNIIFSWQTLTAGIRNESYEFTLVHVPLTMNPNDAINNSGTPLVNKMVLTTSTFAYGPDQVPLILGERYAWRVRAFDETGETKYENDGYSTVCVFRYGDPLIEHAALTPVAPRGNAVVKAGVPVSFQWTSSPLLAGLNEYSFRFFLSELDPVFAADKESYLQSISQPVTTQQALYVHPGELEQGGRYAWQVICIRKGNGSDESETIIGKTPVMEFTVESPARMEYPVALKSPANGSTLAENPYTVPGDVIFEWTSPAGFNHHGAATALSYRFRLVEGAITDYAKALQAPAVYEETIIDRTARPASALYYMPSSNADRKQNNLTEYPELKTGAYTWVIQVSAADQAIGHSVAYTFRYKKPFKGIVLSGLRNSYAEAVSRFYLFNENNAYENEPVLKISQNLQSSIDARLVFVEIKRGQSAEDAFKNEPVHSAVLNGLQINAGKEYYPYNVHTLWQSGNVYAVRAEDAASGYVSEPQFFRKVGNNTIMLLEPAPNANVSPAATFRWSRPSISEVDYFELKVGDKTMLTTSDTTASLTLPGTGCVKTSKLWKVTGHLKDGSTMESAEGLFQLEPACLYTTAAVRSTDSKTSFIHFTGDDDIFFVARPDQANCNYVLPEGARLQVVDIAAPEGAVLGEEDFKNGKVVFDSLFKNNAHAIEVALPGERLGNGAFAVRVKSPARYFQFGTQPKTYFYRLYMNEEAGSFCRTQTGSFTTESKFTKAVILLRASPASVGGQINIVETREADLNNFSGKGKLTFKLFGTHTIEKEIEFKGLKLVNQAASETEYLIDGGEIIVEDSLHYRWDQELNPGSQMSISRISFGKEIKVFGTPFQELQFLDAGGKARSMSGAEDWYVINSDGLSKTVGPREELELTLLAPAGLKVKITKASRLLFNNKNSVVVNGSYSFQSSAIGEFVFPDIIRNADGNPVSIRFSTTFGGRGVKHSIYQGKVSSISGEPAAVLPIPGFPDLTIRIFSISYALLNSTFIACEDYDVQFAAVGQAGKNNTFVPGAQIDFKKVKQVPEKPILSFSDKGMEFATTLTGAVASGHFHGFVSELNEVKILISENQLKDSYIRLDVIPYLVDKVSLKIPLQSDMSSGFGFLDSRENSKELSTLRLTTVNPESEGALQKAALDKGTHNDFLVNITGASLAEGKLELTASMAWPGGKLEIPDFKFTISSNGNISMNGAANDAMELSSHPEGTFSGLPFMATKVKVNALNLAGKLTYSFDFIGRFILNNPDLKVADFSFSGYKLFGFSNSFNAATRELVTNALQPTYVKEIDYGKKAEYNPNVQSEARPYDGTVRKAPSLEDYNMKIPGLETLSSFKLAINIGVASFETKNVSVASHPRYGTVLVSDTKLKMAAPVPFETQALFVTGVKDGLSFWFVEVESKTDFSREGQGAAGDQTHANGIPLGPVTITGLGGRVFYHMKHTDILNIADRDFEPSEEVGYGGMFKAFFKDTKSNGTFLTGFAGFEFTSTNSAEPGSIGIFLHGDIVKKDDLLTPSMINKYLGKDNAIGETMRGYMKQAKDKLDASFGSGSTIPDFIYDKASNAAGNLNLTSQAALTINGAINYIISEKRFIATFDAIPDQATICGGGKMVADFRPDYYNIKIGGPNKADWVSLYPCFGPGFTFFGWLQAEDTPVSNYFDVGVGVGFRPRISTGKINLIVLEFEAYAEAWLNFYGAARLTTKPDFTLQRLTVGVDVGARIGGYIKPIFPPITIGGDFLYANLTGEISVVFNSYQEQKQIIDITVPPKFVMKDRDIFSLTSYGDEGYSMSTLVDNIRNAISQKTNDEVLFDMIKKHTDKYPASKTAFISVAFEMESKEKILSKIKDEAARQKISQALDSPEVLKKIQDAFKNDVEIQYTKKIHTFTYEKGIYVKASGVIRFLGFIDARYDMSYQGTFDNAGLSNY